MATERQLEEIVARCVATMVLFQNEGRTRSSAKSMKAEVRAAADLVSGLGLTPAQVDECIHARAEAELVDRYGSEAGGRLCHEFARAYGRPVGPDPVLSPAAV